MEVATRRLHFGGCTANPTEPWMKQMASNLTDCEDGSLNGKRFLIMDRDMKFTDGFCEILECQGVEAVKLLVAVHGGASSGEAETWLLSLATIRGTGTVTPCGPRQESPVCWSRSV